MSPCKGGAAKDEEVTLQSKGLRFFTLVRASTCSARAAVRRMCAASRRQVGISKRRRRRRTVRLDENAVKRRRTKSAKGGLFCGGESKPGRIHPAGGGSCSRIRIERKNQPQPRSAMPAELTDEAPHVVPQGRSGKGRGGNPAFSARFQRPLSALGRRRRRFHRSVGFYAAFCHPKSGISRRLQDAVVISSFFRRKNRRTRAAVRRH